MKRKVYENHEEYILDVLKDEEMRLIEKIEDRSVEEYDYLFDRYMSVRREINKIKLRIG